MALLIRLLEQTKFTFLLFLSCFALACEAEITKNGFVIDEPLIPANEIFRGGPLRDGIPSIDNPKFVAAKDAGFLQPDDRVMGISLGKESKAYPIRILNYHEIVNDKLNGKSVVVSFCPLCGTGMAFDSDLGKKNVEFGVSGLLYNSDLLMYDRATDSLWSQIEGKAVNGPLKGRKLKRLVVEHTSWADWRARHPKSQVLSYDTGHWRNYDSTPYPGYQQSESLYFPISNSDKRYHPKELVVGIEVNGKTKAYPFVELDKTAPKKNTSSIIDNVSGKKLRFEYDVEHRTARVFDESGKAYPSLIAFWFAWMTFHPDSDVYKAPGSGS